jgi:hypothetical protein
MKRRDILLTNSWSCRRDLAIMTPTALVTATSVAAQCALRTQIIDIVADNLGWKAVPLI